MHMQTVISYILRYENHFRKQMQERMRLESEEKIKAWRQQLAKSEKRILELDRLFIKIYEDNASGKRRQDIRISYDEIGFIPLNELMKEETA